MKAGTACEACARRGHFCPAAVTLGKVDGSGEEALCLDCADEKPCVADRCRGQGRESSSAAVTPADLNEFLEPEDSAPPPIVHRTPEELGVPRFVPTAAPAARITQHPESLRAARWPAGASLESMEQRLGLRTAAPAPKRERGRPRRPARITSCGAANAAPETKAALGEVAKAAVGILEKESSMPKGKYGFRTPDDVRQKIIAEPDGMALSVIAQRYGVSEATARAIRKAAGKTGAGRGREADEQAAVDGGGAAARGDWREAKQPGRCAVRALDRVDEKSERIRVALELSKEELAEMLKNLAPVQREAFLSAGVRAALLTAAES